MAKKQSILQQADSIINDRSEEKERMYGPFSEGMRRAAMIATGMTGKEFTGSDIYAAMVALKLSRHSYSYKQDNLLDACAYLGALDNYVDEFGYKDTEKQVELGEQSNESK
tara:strand:- start:27640 stop:27972 length:333 start_codon:yes stop_codon:yes gene_type:complete